MIVLYLKIKFREVTFYLKKIAHSSYCHILSITGSVIVQFVIVPGDGLPISMNDAVQKIMNAVGDGFNIDLDSGTITATRFNSSSEYSQRFIQYVSTLFRFEVISGF